MILNYNGSDLSGYVTKYGFVETPRVISGKNVGTAMDGSDIPDIIAVKRDLTVTLRPLTSVQAQIFFNLVSGSASNTYKTLSYSSADGSTRTILAKVTMTGATKVMETSEHTLYDGMTVTFTEK